MLTFHCGCLWTRVFVATKKIANACHQSEKWTQETLGLLGLQYIYGNSLELTTASFDMKTLLVQYAGIQKRRNVNRMNVYLR